MTANTPYSIMSRTLSSMFQLPEGPSGLMTKSSRKRERHRDMEEASGDLLAEYSKAKVKRSRHHASDSDTIADPRYLIVHHVICEAQRHHHLHERQAYYLDVPRLFQGDCKASTLRGKRRISSIDEYLENNADISIVTYKTYSCNQYYDSVGDQFERLPMPSHPQNINSLAPYFFHFPKDGDEAGHQSQRMAVLSSTLKDAIHLVTGLDSERIANLHLKQSTDDLYHLLYHCRRLKDQIDRELGEEHRHHLEVMIKFVNEAFGRDYDEADELFSRDLVTQTHLPKLFGPNEVVVSTQDGQLRAYVINSSPESDRLPVILDCWSWEFDGLFRKERTKLQVDWPSSAETLPISELSAYPLRFDQSGLSDTLKRRGEMFWKCRRERLVAYNPPTASFQMQTSNPRYMVDMNTYREINDVSGLPPQRDDLGQDVMDQEEPPEGSFSLLLPATILGFGFHDRKWRSLAIDHVSDVNWNTKAFEHLVIDPQKKDLVEALVNTQSAASNTTDFMEGKGNGLIILLHGGPGTGKTLTAESVAELTKKPLYRIACGDIGTNAEEVEKYLVSVFYIGTIWKCVVLLDEADVFLEERQTDQLQRNALVSVFLRALEYYDGILILTSNRVGTFDEAFKSRVQISLHYPRLNKRSRAKVWLNFIDSLDAKDAKVEQLRKRIALLAKKNLNGREIRNTVKSAMQLANFKQEKLEYSHLERVIDVSTEFTTYLKEVHGHSEAEWAESKGIRGKD